MPNHHTVSKNMRVETVFRYVTSFLQRGKTGNAIFIICEKGRLMQSTFNIYIYIIFANFPLILDRLSQMRGSFFQNSIFYTLFFKKNICCEKKWTGPLTAANPSPLIRPFLHLSDNRR